jgi:hypothetical protein
MLDGFVLKGTPINYYDEDWVIGDVLFVPGNPQLYVELKKGGITMNVRWVDISPIITKEPKFTDIYEYDFV